VLFNDAVKGYDYILSVADVVTSMNSCSDDTDREEQKYCEKNLSHFHNIHHKSQVDQRGIQPRLRGDTSKKPPESRHRENFV